MGKWKVKYTMIDSNKNRVEKTTEVYGANPFDAYYNANKLLSILERGRIIDKLFVEAIG